MNLEFSVDKLYETGWQPRDRNACERLPDGRLYPSLVEVTREFALCGYDLAIRNVQLFGCFRAVWSDQTGAAAGAVVGADEREAAVYALAQLRRSAPSVQKATP